ncbi:MBL fold metallo-hydrolase [Phytoactinopolyspora alkaliphila]|uniref:MBL fold metallo-hydrolase n=1 Tax=Phytoactinopolyspora alkaliphila TaxID=1783498 RepID=A0A6N9YS33_9ACTN|nr:MBL fold metallo-hydrolase [Phytoactinopolyspora alkaliphila]NED97648.1 MBL fold metallo-hydrolase [Phytoactinopolyspora alkaliphila]
MTVRIGHTTTSGTFSLDGKTILVDNNAWIVGDEHECVVIDAPHDGSAILDVVSGRQVLAILLTHGHDDHLGAVGSLWDATGAQIFLHPADRMLWDRVYPGVAPDAHLVDGKTLTVGGEDLHVLHTPGHTPGSVCFYLPSANAVFTGDTLIRGGAGSTGGSFSDSGALARSIQDRLLTLPPDTTVYPGHGDTTTITAESAPGRAATSA